QGRVEELKNAIRFNPNDLRSYLDLGWAYMQLGFHDKAMDVLLHARRLSPKNDAVHHGLAELFTRMKRTGEAWQEWLQTIQLNPDDAEAHGQLAGVCLELNRYV